MCIFRLLLLSKMNKLKNGLKTETDSKNDFKTENTATSSKNKFQTEIENIAASSKNDCQREIEATQLCILKIVFVWLDIELSVFNNNFEKAS